MLGHKTKVEVITEANPIAIAWLGIFALEAPATFLVCLPRAMGGLT